MEKKFISIKEGSLKNQDLCIEDDVYVIIKSNYGGKYRVDETHEDRDGKFIECHQINPETGEDWEDPCGTIWGHCFCYTKEELMEIYKELTSLTSDIEKDLKAEGMLN